MPAYIHHIETIVPEQVFTQEQTRDLIKKNVNSDRRAVQSIIHRVYSQSEIEKRHSVIKDFEENDDTPLFFDKNGDKLEAPSTKKRNDTYTKEATRLFCKVARQALENAQVSPQEITHVITVSCTGFFAPGPEYYIVKELGLNPSTERYHIGFMGCFAAFPALKMAEAFCRNNENAHVLVVALELCTLHLQFNADIDTILSGSVFADGGAAVLISGKKPSNKTALKTDGFQTGITPKGEKDMAWTIGDEGFDMVLTTYVPDIIEENIQPMTTEVLDKFGKSVEDITYWAVHPGGRAIVDRIQNSLSLTDKDVSASRKVLKDNGNMSSATVLFVMKEILQNTNIKPGEKMLSMAFGPGLTVETGLFEVIGA